ncbi:hypothetical protein [Desulfatibacillum aliphaticivorans]|uniref:hypothetical protein n=1 Tax=Desulfatibacillum aliphaticivorans TaxID=218208 RepID=UPI0005C1DA41|nr:hypothetical protein [Desulfatibacillum aliphaticivorans]
MNKFIDIFLSMLSFIFGIHVLVAGKFDVRGIEVEGLLAIAAGAMLAAAPFWVAYRYWSREHSQNGNWEE